MINLHRCIETDCLARVLDQDLPLSGILLHSESHMSSNHADGLQMRL